MMLRIPLFVIVLLVSIGAPGAATSDETAIRQVIEHGYVEGIWRQRDPDMVRKYFAPQFVMQLYWNDELSSRTLDEWLDRMKLDRKPGTSKIRADIDVLHVVGIAGLAKVDLYEDGTQKYTDYFSLYKTEDGWQIVSKIFHSW